MEASDPHLGPVVTDCRSSWVRRATFGATEVYVKTYDYPTYRDRVRGWLRTTWMAPSRAEREWDALAWLREHGIPAPEPLAAGEVRHLGVLRRAVLVTQAWPGEPLDRLLPTLSAPDREAVLDAVVRYVESLHRAGFRDRNLDLRNLLGRRDGTEAFEVVKIDSPRYRVVQRGSECDRLAQRDWERLSRSIDELAQRGGRSLAPDRERGSDL